MMQNLVDSLCQCFGAGVPKRSKGSTRVETYGSQEKRRHARSEREQIGTPDSKRRTRGLALKDQQWDAVFTEEQKGSKQKHSPKHLRRGVSMDQAQAVAKAKLAATVKPQRSRSHPHKRKRSGSKDDIFRSKQGPTTNSNPLSRFLSNNPAIGNALCFANPIRDSADDGCLCDAGSVVSESNTLNTAEDTITSTLYYEKTKLAGLKQKNPPVPLFNCFSVEPEDDIRQIVMTHSHSSVKLLDMYGNKKNGHQHVVLEDDESATPPSSPGRRADGQLVTGGSDNTPPPIANLSSDSDSKSSNNNNVIAAPR